MKVSNLITALRIQDPLKSYDIQKKFEQIIESLNYLPIYIGTGSPENKESAKVGSIYLRLDGGTNTTLYVKESGESTTGWVGK